jgi:hypothetical protein
LAQTQKEETMKYALVIVEYPSGDEDEDKFSWHGMRSNAQSKTSKSGKVSTLSEGCYLCDLSNGLLDLNKIVGAAEAYNLVSRTLFFENEPSFIVSKRQ